MQFITIFSIVIASLGIEFVTLILISIIGSNTYYYYVKRNIFVLKSVANLVSRSIVT